MKISVLFFALIFFTSCANFTKTASGFDLDGQFKLIKIDGKDVSSEDLFFNFLPAENRVFGDTGCNGFAANFKQENEKIDFIDPLSTRKFCDGKMKIENAILSALQETKSFEKKENEFVFYSEAKNELFTLKNIQEVE